MSDPQNIYDQPQFFAGYSQMERFGAGWTRALEQPLFLELLPNPVGLHVLDLGCGLGQLSYHLAQAGAAEVLAVDVSRTMLERARSHPRVTYTRQAIEEVRFPSERFELIVSSLALHYVADYTALVRRIVAWLTPGGVLVYAVCSVDPRETTEVIATAFAKHPLVRGLLPAALEPFETDEGDLLIPPGIEGRDGFFIARLERRP